MDVQAILDRVTDSITVKRVFGEPIRDGDTLIIPVARLGGGLGGGSGTGPPEEGSGSGGGAGFNAKPVGLYRIHEGTVTWHPALDLNKVILGGQVVAIVVALAVRSILTRG